LAPVATLTMTAFKTSLNVRVCFVSGYARELRLKTLCTNFSVSLESYLSFTLQAALKPNKVLASVEFALCLFSILL